MSDLVCRCGHVRSKHTRATGPISTGQYFWDQCKHGWDRLGEHLFEVKGACPCHVYRLRWWWPWSRKGPRS